MRWKVILSWIALVPAVFIGSGLCKEILEWFFKWTICSNFGFDPDGNIPFYGSKFIGNIFYGVSIVYLAYYIAPNHKIITTFVLSICNMVIAIGMILYAFYSRADFMFAMLIYYTAFITACIISLIFIFQEHALNNKPLE
jgi:ABC-type Na+ efflux pump permease subunit